MSFFLKASMLVVLFSGSGLVDAEEKIPASPSSTKETMLPGFAAEEPPSQAITLEEVIKQVMKDAKSKLLAAKTEVLEGKKIHIIKVLTSTGHIQYIKIDAATGKNLDNPKK